MKLILDPYKYGWVNRKNNEIVFVGDPGSDNQISTCKEIAVYEFLGRNIVCLFKNEVAMNESIKAMFSLEKRLNLKSKIITKELIEIEEKDYNRSTEKFNLTIKPDKLWLKNSIMLSMLLEVLKYKSTKKFTNVLKGIRKYGINNYLKNKWFFSDYHDSGIELNCVNYYIPSYYLCNNLSKDLNKKTFLPKKNAWAAEFFIKKQKSIQKNK